MATVVGHMSDDRRRRRAPGQRQSAAARAEVRDNGTVAGPAVVFPAGTEVWWSAELSTEQAPEADAMVVVRRDGVEIDRQYVPADPSVGTWNLLCAAEPVQDGGSGLYRVEVWDGELVLLHAQGEYRVAAP